MRSKIFLAISHAKADRMVGRLRGRLSFDITKTVAEGWAKQVAFDLGPFTLWSMTPKTTMPLYELSTLESQTQIIENADSSAFKFSIPYSRMDEA